MRAFQSEYHEAHWIARTVGQALAARVAPADILVLARASYATEPVQTALAHAGIPHRVLGSLGLYERAEIRDALAYLTLLVNPANAQAFRRAVQAPRRGVGTATITHLVALARERQRRERAQLALLSALPVRQRTVLLKGAGFSYEETADSVGVSLRTVERQITRGRQRLREASQASG